MKVAIIHDWLTGMRGGERCLEAFLDIYPEADIFTLIHIKGATSEKIDSRVKGVSFLNKLPKISLWYRYALPLFPFAIRGFNLKDYDLIISLSHCVAKNIKKPKNATHICYCFTPMRYVWDQMQEYFGKKTKILFPILFLLRKWDKYASKNVDYFIAISNLIKARIRCFYKRNSTVIYPPCNAMWQTKEIEYKKGEAFLMAGAMVPYKNPDIIVKVFNDLNLPLWVVGSGPLKNYLKSIAKENVKFLGRISDEELSFCYKNSRALIFAGKEDYGIIPIETLSSGRPVIGLFDGGLKETINAVKYWKEENTEGKTGVFVKKGKDIEENLKEAIQFFIKNEDKFLPKDCVNQALKFSEEKFKDNWQNFINKIN